MMRWHGSFPLWTATPDGRRIVGCSARTTPMPLLNLADGRWIGAIETVTFKAWAMGAYVVLEGPLGASYETQLRAVLEGNATVKASPDEWHPIHMYLAPDLGAATTIASKNSVEIDGQLIACHLGPDRQWPLQTGVTVTL